MYTEFRFETTLENDKINMRADTETILVSMLKYEAYLIIKNIIRIIGDNLGQYTY